MTQLIGWIGVILTTFASIPQLKNVHEVSRATYAMLFWGIIGLLVRAIAIREYVFIIGEFLSLVFVVLVWIKLKKHAMSSAKFEQTELFSYLFERLTR